MMPIPFLTGNRGPNYRGVARNGMRRGSSLNAQNRPGWTGPQDGPKYFTSPGFISPPMGVPHAVGKNKAQLVNLAKFLQDHGRPR